MASQKTITINGREYDAVTGMPITKNSHDAPKSVPKAAPTAPKTTPQSTPPSKPAVKPVVSHSAHPAGDVHSTVRRSQTLARRVAKKPATPQKILNQRPGGRSMDIARSSKVTHFAPHPAPKAAATSQPVAATKPSRAAATADIPARVHPTVKRALEKKASQKPIAAKPATAKQVKEEAIEKALRASKEKPVKAKKKRALSKWQKRLIIIGIIILVIFGVLYAIYRLVPSISVGIAASQAGVSATYPEYTPDGFTLSQPVSYSDGQVVLKFTSNSNDTAYTITQTRSSWDSSAIVDNIVQPKVGDNYVTTKERGLTIYSYGNSASWVNGGVLYTIDSSAALSGDQIRHIATSL